MFNLQFQNSRLTLCRFFVVFSFSLFVSVMTANANTFTFANFIQSDGGLPAFRFVRANPGDTTGTFETYRLIGATPSNNVPVDFRYVSGTDPDTGIPFGILNLPAELRGDQPARLVLTSSTSSTSGSPAFNQSGNVIQPITETTTITITRNTAASVGTGTGTRRNLLTVVITTNTNPARLSGPGGSGGFSATTPDQFVTFTSDFIDFSSTTERNTSITSSGINPALNLPVGETIIDSFSAPFLGSFASNPIPTYNPPTAAAVNIGGRVMTSAGRGINRARVTLSDGNGETRTAVSNIFGYYRFESVSAGQTVIVSAAAKQYLFNPQVVSLEESLTDLNFPALNQLPKTKN